jgi:hypothetical protein
MREFACFGMSFHQDIADENVRNSRELIAVRQGYGAATWKI